MSYVWFYARLVVSAAWQHYSSLVVQSIIIFSVNSILHHRCRSDYFSSKPADLSDEQRTQNRMDFVLCIIIYQLGIYYLIRRVRFGIGIVHNIRIYFDTSV